MYTIRGVVKSYRSCHIRNSTFGSSIANWSRSEKPILQILDLPLLYPPTNPYIDEMFMIHPRSPCEFGSCVIICAVTYLHIKKIDRALTSIVFVQSSSDVSCSFCGWRRLSTDKPAEFTSLKPSAHVSKSQIYSMYVHIDSAKMSYCLAD